MACQRHDACSPKVRSQAFPICSLQCVTRHMGLPSAHTTSHMVMALLQNPPRRSRSTTKIPRMQLNAIGVQRSRSGGVPGMFLFFSTSRHTLEKCNTIDPKADSTRHSSIYIASATLKKKKKKKKSVESRGRGAPT
eukprot:2792820-Prymnesium_polylepis.1